MVKIRAARTDPVTGNTEIRCTGRCKEWKTEAGFHASNLKKSRYTCAECTNVTLGERNKKRLSDPHTRLAQSVRAREHRLGNACRINRDDVTAVIDKFGGKCPLTGRTMKDNWLFTIVSGPDTDQELNRDNGILVAVYGSQIKKICEGHYQWPAEVLANVQRLCHPPLRAGGGRKLSIT